MELSPLARERLARIGALSPEEKEKASQSGELDSLLSEYFTGNLSSDDLWKRLKALQDRSGKSITKEAQLKLLDTLRLQMNQVDFEQRRNAILAVETVKDKGDYSNLELVLTSLETLRQKYTQIKEQAYQQLRASVEKQLHAVAQQAIRQGMKIDMENSIDANVKASPQWKDFISKHEQACGEMFTSHIDKLRELI